MVPGIQSLGVIMSTQQQLVLRPITRGQWLKVVADRGVDSTEPLGRRAHRRYQTSGVARLSSPPDDNNPGDWIHTRVMVWEVSAGGLALKSGQMISENRPVDVELYLGGDACTLSGTVIHCTQSVSGFSVGIELHFSG